MKNDFKLFIDGVREKTGLDLAVFSDSGELVGGNASEKETVPDTVKGIVRDEENSRTLFVIRHKQKKFIGRISGVGEPEKNYAFFITELAENYFSKEVEYSRSEFFKAILHGEMDYSHLRKYLNKFSIPELSCFVMIISVEKGNIDDVVGVLLNYGNADLDFAVKTEEGQCAFIKFTDDVSDEYQSSTQYADFLRQSVYEETGIPVKITVGGTVKSVYDLSASYLQASTALIMSRALDSKGNVHSYKEYILIKLLEDLPKHKLSEGLEILTETNSKEIFSDEEMINTAEEFLENSLNISETSRKLYLHRNTLVYRLDKIEKATGLNVRKFSDAVTFRLITILAKLVK